MHMLTVNAEVQKIYLNDSPAYNKRRCSIEQLSAKSIRYDDSKEFDIIEIDTEDCTLQSFFMIPREVYKVLIDSGLKNGNFDFVKAGILLKKNMDKYNIQFDLK